jgi:carboxymethylenebutenolidase
VHESVINLTRPDGDMGVLAKRPDGDGPHPVVVMYHDGPGVRDATHACMERVVAAGYYVVCPDRYYRFGPFLHVDPFDMRDPAKRDGVWSKMREWLFGTTDAMVSDDLDALVHHLGSDPAASDGAMGAIGFCIGGRSVIRAAAAHPERFTVGVGLHPSFCVTDDDDSPHLSVESYPGRLFFGFGKDDQMQSVAMHQKLLDACDATGGRSGYAVYSGADHGFAVPGPSHHPTAADQGYGAAIGLFDRHVNGH